MNGKWKRPPQPAAASTRHGKRSLPEVHRANITALRTPDVTDEPQRARVDTAKARRTASQLCVTARESQQYNLRSVGPPSDTNSASGANSDECPYGPTLARTSWLNQLRSLAAPQASSSNISAAQPLCSPPLKRRESPRRYPRASNSNGNGLSQAIYRLVYGKRPAGNNCGLSNRSSSSSYNPDSSCSYEHQRKSTTAHSTSADAGSFGDSPDTSTQLEGAGSNPAATAHHRG